jgi:hypothetical protein
VVIAALGLIVAAVALIPPFVQIFQSPSKPSTSPASTPSTAVFLGSSQAASSPTTSSGTDVPLAGEILTLEDLSGRAVPADRIPAHIAVTGRVHPVPLPAGHELWLLVGFPEGNWFPGNGDRLDPGTGPDMSLLIGPDGHWHNPDLAFGSDDQACDRFDLVLADVGKEYGVPQLVRYYARNDPSGPVGIPRDELADDIKPLARTSVTRAPRCPASRAKTDVRQQPSHHPARDRKDQLLGS